MFRRGKGAGGGGKGSSGRCGRCGLSAQLAACCIGPAQLGWMQLWLVARGTSPGVQLTSVGVVTRPPPPVGGVWRHSRFVPIARGDGEAVPVHLFNTLGGGGGAGG